MDKIKVIDIKDMVSAYSAFVDLLFGKKIGYGPGTTVSGLSQLSAFLDISAVETDISYTKPKKKPEGPAPEKV